MSRIRLFLLYLPGLVWISLLAMTSGCSTTKDDRLGLQIDGLAYIPARIAVLPCRTWPEQASYRGMLLSNVSRDVKSDLCKAIDQFVVDGFKNQPYMRGISPTVVLALLEREKEDELLDRIDELWRRQPGDCSRCTSASAYYNQAIAQRESWRLWLSRFSRAAFNSDAVLIPFITYTHEGRTVERGLTVAHRNAGGLLALIDTNTGTLIWTGGREAQARQQKPNAQSGPDEPTFPDWPEVISRLLIDELWMQFPGRQNY